MLCERFKGLGDFVCIDFVKEANKIAIFANANNEK